MKKIMLIFFCFISLVAFALTGKVIKVADGDTVTIQTDTGEKVRVRLYGIDAPESKQEYGVKSADTLRKLTNGKVVDIEVKDKDRYGRTVGIIFLDGKDMNLYQIQEGNAWYYKQYGKDRPDYGVAEKKARADKIGLWQYEKPIAPWDFRRKK